MIIEREIKWRDRINRSVDRCLIDQLEQESN